MPIPATVPDRLAYRGDAFQLKVVLPDTLDITGSTFTANLDDDAGDWTIDTSHLAAHYITLNLTAAVTAAIATKYVSWDLAETPALNRTILCGRIELSGQV